MGNIIENNSIKEYYIKIEKMMNNAVNILTAINQSLSSPSPEITIDLVNTDSSVDNTVTTLRIPSYLYLESKIEQIDNVISNLFTIPKNGEAWFERSSNMYKLSLVKSNNAPAIPTISNLDSLGFNIKDNNIFKDLVNPKTCIKLNISNLPECITNIVVDKIIVYNENDAEYLKLFNTYSDVKAALYNKQKGLDYDEYESVLDMPIKADHYNSFFKIQRVDVVESEDNTFFEYSLRLDTLTYYDKDDASIQYQLQVGDLLCLPNEYTVYKVKDIRTIYNDINKNDDNEYIVSIEEFVGHIGLQTFEENSEMYLQIYNDTYKKYHYVDVPLEENPYIILFVSTVYNNIRSTYSDAIHLNLNNIYMKDSNGNYILDENNNKINYIDYYKKYCNNIGDILNGISKISYPQVASYSNNELYHLTTGDDIKALVTSSLYNDSNIRLKVTRINAHLIDTTLTNNIIEYHKQKSEINEQIKSVQSSIDEIYEKLATLDFTQEPILSQDNLRSQLSDYYKERLSLENQLISIVENINKSKSGIIGLDESKYRIRGITDVNDLNDNDTESPIITFLHSQFGNNCDIIGMDVEYKYRSASKDSSTLLSTDTSIFTEWNKLKTIDRERYIKFDVDSNTYKITYNNYNPLSNIVKWNQIDIPINYGEDVVVRVRYKYNIGQPYINLYTPWSEEQTIVFPDEYNESEDVSYIIDMNDKDLINSNFMKSLINKGYEEHMSNKIVDNNQIFYHMPENIYSGFNTPENNLISLKDKLVSMNEDINSYKLFLDNENNQKYEIYLEWDDTSVKLSNARINNITINDTTNGITDTFVKKNMNIVIKNTGELPIRLYSLFPGNTDIPLIECENEYFNSYLNSYERVPLLLSGVQIPSESIIPQKMGQWIYFRQDNPYTRKSIYYDNVIQDTLDTTNIKNGQKPSFVQDLSKYIGKDNSQLLLSYRNRKNDNNCITWSLLTKDNSNNLIYMNYTDDLYTNPYHNVDNFYIYDNTDDSNNYLLKYEHLRYSDNITANTTYLSNNISFSEFIKPFTKSSLTDYAGAFLIPELLTNEQLLCDGKENNQYLTLDSGNTVVVPILFEYLLVPDNSDGTYIKSISKSLAFDIKTSLINDPSHYVLTVTAKYDYSFTLTGSTSYRTMVDGLESI